MFGDSRPIFQQIAESLVDDILRGRYAEGEQVPSTNELAVFLRINPATAGKGLGLLVEQGILEKRRGVGMFVTVGAKARIAAERRDRFTTDFIQPLLAEAQTIGLTREAIVRLIAESTPGGAADSGLPPTD